MLRYSMYQSKLSLGLHVSATSYHRHRRASLRIAQLTIKFCRQPCHLKKPGSRFSQRDSCKASSPKKWHSRSTSSADASDPHQ